MQQILINQSMVMFDTPEKWNAFLELHSIKDLIKNQWYEKLRISLLSRFNKDEAMDKWKFSFSNGHQDYRWYLAEFNSESLCLRTCNLTTFGLWFNPGNHDSKKIYNLLHTSKYSIILDILRPDQLFPANDWVLQETGNFSFNSPYNSQFNEEHLSWFAGNETDKLTDQIVEKINRFRKDETITGLIAEINRDTKIIR